MFLAEIDYKCSKPKMQLIQPKINYLGHVLRWKIDSDRTASFLIHQNPLQNDRLNYWPWITYFATISQYITITHDHNLELDDYAQ